MQLHTALERVSGAAPAEMKLPLYFVVRNAHRVSQRFCPYMTPFEGFKGDIFEVIDAQGHRLPYRGIKVKRSAPGPEDYIELAPGEEKGTAFDLSKAYDLSEGAPFTVRFLGSPSLNGLPDTEVIRIADAAMGA